MPSLVYLSRLSLSAVLLSIPVSSALSQQVRSTSAHRESERPLSQSITGGTKAARDAASAERTGLSLGFGLFHGGGTKDLLTGYATRSGGVLVLQRGVPEATAPTDVELSALRAGQVIAPFRSDATAFQVPVAPDLMLINDLRGNGGADAVIAKRGDTSLYYLAGDKQGGLAAAQPIALLGGVESIASWRAADGKLLLVAAVHGGSMGNGLDIVTLDGTHVGFVPMEDAPSRVDVVSHNGGSLRDLLVIAGRKLQMIDGDDLLSGTPVIETLPVTDAVAVASGSFIYDRRGIQQIAVLDAAGTLHVLTRAGVDSTALSPLEARAAAHRAQPDARRDPSAFTRTKLTGQSWTEAESIPSVGAGDGGSPVMISGRFQGGGLDELAVMSGTRYALVTHAARYANGTMTTTSTVMLDSSSGAVVAASSGRIAASASSGLVALYAGQLQPLLSQLPPNRTMNVNTNSDAVPNGTSMGACESGGAGCTLRAAIAVANSDAGANGTTKADTINLQGNNTTYTLSATQTANTYDIQGDYNYHFPIDASVNIIGAGASSTTIDANQQDVAFMVNPGVMGANANNNYYNPTTTDVYISGVTIKNGLNRNNLTSSVCNGGNASAPGYFCISDGGAIQEAFYNGGALTLNGVTITSSAAVYTGSSSSNGDSDEALGGAISAGNTTNFARGNVEVDNSTFMSNTSGYGGGAISIDPNGNCTQYTLTNDTFTNNSTGVSTDSSSQNALAEGGAVFASGISSSGSCSTTNTITTLTASGNAATDRGGALSLTGEVTATGLALSGNQAGAFGGGLYSNPADFSQNFSASSFTTNKLVGNPRETYSGFGGSANGAGVCVESGSAGTTASFQYSRFSKNTISASTSGPASTGLGVSCVGGASNTLSVTANNNWWGCNATISTGAYGNAISGAGCDTATSANNSTEKLTATTSTSLLLSLSPSTVNYGTSLTATTSLGQNNSGTVYSAAEDAAYLLTPITTFTLTNAGTITYNPSATGFNSSSASATSNAAATARATPTASGTATVTVDNQTLTANYTVTAPDLTVTSTHSGNFKAGDAADTYTLTVGNSGTGPTNSTVSVTDSLPSGFTATAMSGSGWTCTVGTLTCTRSDTLAASVTYPAVTLTVSVSTTAAGSYTNTVHVGGGGEENTSNDTGTDPTTVIGYPGAPTIGTATAGNAQATVTFTAPASNGGSAITNYTVTSSPGNITASGTGSPITVTGLTNGTPYTFTVTATNTVGAGAASAASNSVTPSTVPSAPMIGTVTVLSSTSASVAFTAGANGGSTITGCTATSSPSSVTGTSSGSSPITVSGLTAGTAYTFSVKCSNANGAGLSSSASNSVTTFSVPGAPTGLIATGANAQASVSFTAPASNGGTAITGYTVTSSPGNFTGSGAASPITVTGLSNGTAYTFTVRATNSVGSGTASAASNAVTPSTVPNAPTIGTATGLSSTSASVAFTPGANGGAAITVCTATSSPGGLTGTSSGSSPITVAGLTSGATYTFTVMCSNANGASSASAASNSVTLISVPGMPTSVSATAADAQATVSFTAPASNGGSAITSYTVTSSPGNVTASSATSPINLTGLANGTTYTFSVTATNAVGTGAASAASNVVTPSASMDSYIWVIYANGQVGKITENGDNTVSSQGSTGASSSRGGGAIDGTGTVWTVSSANNSLQSATSSGAHTFTGGGLSAPVAVAVDGGGNIWVANSGNGTVSEFNAAGIALTPAAGYATGGAGPSGVALDISGSVWVSNATSGTVTRVIGAALPSATPLASAASNGQVGSAP